MAKPNGAILWRGASLLNGAPIVVIATGLRSGSSNSKTGAMVQTYILCENVAPTVAVKTGADADICGGCPHRGDGTGAGRTCYVNVGQGPQSVWKAYKRGAYPVAIEYAGLYFLDRSNGAPCIGKSALVRLGTYGDPAAVPAAVWRMLVSRAIGHTGYTHQWRTAGDQLRALCMASADSVQDAQEAHGAGWRTFRVAMPCDAPRMVAESVCPASAEAGKKLTCAQCLACSGAGSGRRGSIVIQAHGGFAVMANVGKRAARMLAASHPQPKR